MNCKTRIVSRLPLQFNILRLHLNEINNESDTETGLYCQHWFLRKD